LNLVLSFIGVELCGGNMVGFKHPKRAVTVAMAKTRSLFGKEFPPPSRLVFNASAAGNRPTSNIALEPRFNGRFPVGCMR
jgi:hypothetical protein